MSLAPMKYQKPKPRYRLNLTRFVSVILVFLLILTAVIVILAKDKEDSNEASVVVTPAATPRPTPTPYPVPEGKIMEPVLIVIDAGHGGNDPGTTSPYKEGFYEKDITLDIARRVKEYLSEKGIDARLTREDDPRLVEHSDKDLVARYTLANEWKASLFVSIHVNAYDLKYKGAAAVNGLELYYYEKKAPVYSDFSEKRLAEIVRDEIVSATGVKFNGMRGDRTLAVVRNTQMPAVLVETGYITNKEDHDRLASDEYRDKMAQGIAEGILIALEEIGAFEYNGGIFVFKEIGE